MILCSLGGISGCSSPATDGDGAGATGTGAASGTGAAGTGAGGMGTGGTGTGGTGATGMGGTGTGGTGTGGTGTGGTGTGGTGGTGTGGTGGTAGTGTGGTGTGGAAGSGGAAGTAGTGGTGPDNGAGDRCKRGIQKAMDASKMLISDFEGPDPLKLDGSDLRIGSWTETHEDPMRDGSGPNATGAVAAEATSGGAPGSTKALHVTGSGFNAWGGSLAVQLNGCYDASVHKGLSFWVKGTPSTAGTGADGIIVQIHVPATQPEVNGGYCNPPAPDGTGTDVCWAHYRVVVPMTSEWTRYAFPWSVFKQPEWKAVPPATKDGELKPYTYKAESEILYVSWSPRFVDEAVDGRSYDLWIDDVSFDISGELPNHLGTVISSAQYDQIFPGGDKAFYSHQNLVSIAGEYSHFLRGMPVAEQKRQIAAFLAHVQQETGGLVHKEEIDGASKDYCDEARMDWPCAPGQGYHGRGAIQISWNYNYGPFSAALRADSLGNPALAIQSGLNSFRAAVWFWMLDPGGAGRSNIQTALTEKGFGETIKMINGNLECPSAGNPAAQNRIEKFKSNCSVLGCEVGPNLDCTM